MQQLKLEQLKSLLSMESNFITNMANTAAFLKQEHNYFWAGFYTVIDGELLLGPFQGPVACTRISKGKGVCGATWEKEVSHLVPDVYAFPGHIACNPYSKSEVVVPMLLDGTCIGVMDVDSDKLDDFTPDDLAYFEEVVKVLLDSSEVLY